MQKQLFASGHFSALLQTKIKTIIFGRLAEAKTPVHYSIATRIPPGRAVNEDGAVVEGVDRIQARAEPARKTRAHTHRTMARTTKPFKKELS